MNSETYCRDLMYSCATTQQLLGGGVSGSILRLTEMEMHYIGLSIKRCLQGNVIRSSIRYCPFFLFSNRYQPIILILIASVMHSLYHSCMTLLPKTIVVCAYMHPHVLCSFLSWDPHQLNSITAASGPGQCATYSFLWANVKYQSSSWIVTELFVHQQIAFCYWLALLMNELAIRFLSPL